MIHIRYRQQPTTNDRYEYDTTLPVTTCTTVVVHAYQVRTYNPDEFTPESINSRPESTNQFEADLVRPCSDKLMVHQ